MQFFNNLIFKDQMQYVHSSEEEHKKPELLVINRDWELLFSFSADDPAFFWKESFAPLDQQFSAIMTSILSIFSPRVIFQNETPRRRRLGIFQNIRPKGRNIKPATQQMGKVFIVLITYS